MKVVILCGGLGTRLREETEVRPKPMLTIGNKPILWHIMKTYSHHGHDQFVLCLGYKGNVIKDFFLNYRAIVSDITVKLNHASAPTYHDSPLEEDWKVTLAETGEKAMTGARVKRIEKYLDGDDFFLTYGDAVGNVDIKALLAFHRKHGKLATLTGVRPPGRFGELDVKKGLVAEFNEKPQATAGLINGGFFVFKRKVLEQLKRNDDCVLETFLLRRLAKEGQLMCYEHCGFWFPMDTFREYELLNRMWNENQAPWKVWQT